MCPITLRLGFVFTLVLFFPLFADSHRCRQDFRAEAEKVNKIQFKFCQQKTLGVQFAWNYDDKSRRLDIAFGAKLDSETGWLAWGLNQHEPHMVGTQALIGIKHQNGSLECNKYNITYFTRLGCALLPVNDVGLEIPNCSFNQLPNISYYMIKATIILPWEYDSSRTNVVWQIGYAVADKEPKMHPTTIKNFDSAETIDLNHNQVKTYRAHKRNHLRTAHGILNIVGWGTFLPIGVIFARYFRKFPTKSRWWYVLHIIPQIAGYVIGSAGWAIGLWLGKQSKYYSYGTHAAFAIVIFTCATLQILALVLKPERDDPFRKYWSMYHHFVGYALLAIISINIFKGIAILKPDEDAWKWAYIGVLGFLAATVLAFEVYTWTIFILRKIAKRRKANTPSADENVSKSKTAQPQSLAGIGTSNAVHAAPTNLS